MKTLALHRILTTTVVITALAPTNAFIAKADTSIYYDTTKQQRGNDALQADGDYCDGKVGATPNHALPTVAYKKCMLNRGWRFGHKQRDNTQSHTYINYDGMVCHGNGFVAVCDPPQGTVYYRNRRGEPCTRTGLVGVCN
jgi:hypothetical protein